MENFKHVQFIIYLLTSIFDINFKYKFENYETVNIK